MTVDLKLHHLECLVAIVDHGGVRKAAIALDRSPTAVSKSMRELELKVGISLFERHPQGTMPTAAGAILLAHARQVLRQLQRAGEEVMHLGRNIGGTVRMAVTPWLLQSVLPAAIREYRVLRPDVKLFISEHLGDEYAAVRSGDLHFALGLVPDTSQQGTLETRKLFSYTYAVVGRLGHPAANTRRLAELKGYDWLLSGRSVEQFSLVLRDFFTSIRRDKAERHHVSRSLQAALAIVRATDMLTIVPWPLIETPDMRDRFTVLHLDEDLGDNATCLVTRRFEAMPGAVIGFLDCLMRTTREQAASSDAGIRRIFSMVDAH